MGLALATALAMFLACTVFAQGGRKVYISVDMEGISGISGSDQLAPGGSEYGRSRKLMVEDANAAIRGALAGGATYIVVNDSASWTTQPASRRPSPLGASDQP